MNRLIPMMLWVAGLVACGVPAAGGAGRTVTGQLSAASLSRVDNPAIVVRTAEGQPRVVRVARTGDFKLALEPGVSTRLSVATTQPDGTLREDSTIVWPNRWTVVAAGEPIDVGVVRPRGATAKACHRDPGEMEDDDDGDDHACAQAGRRSDLPYDAKIPLGAAFKLTDAFLEKGPVPAKVLSVTMDGGGSTGWRLAELQANTQFTVTQADCAHAGNRSEGRDRVIVRWQNADGSTDSDHLDLRYCDGDRAPSANGGGAVPATGTCGVPPPVKVCDEDDGDESVVDPGPRDGVQLGLEAAAPDRCPAQGVPLPTPVTPGPSGGACTVSAECAPGLACFQSKCVAPIN